MMLPYDPILSPIIVIGVFVYFACKMVGEKKDTAPTKMKKARTLKIGI